METIYVANILKLFREFGGSVFLEGKTNYGIDEAINQIPIAMLVGKTIKYKEENLGYYRNIIGEIVRTVAASMGKADGESDTLVAQILQLETTEDLFQKLRPLIIKILEIYIVKEKASNYPGGGRKR